MALPSERVFYTEPQQRWMGSPNSNWPGAKTVTRPNIAPLFHH